MKHVKEAVIHNLSRSWYVWMFPILALGLCGILLYRAMDHGPRVHISFADAEGITGGRTPVKFRGVSIGIVRSVELDDKGITAEIEMDKGYDRYVVEGSKFWLVEPQVSLNGVTGLSTLRDGTFIVVAPGDPSNKIAKKFTASSPRSETIDEGYSHYTLTTPQLGAMSVGDPIYFRGLPIGQILSVALNEEATMALIRVGIMHRYSSLVNATTMFWRKQGIQANLGLFGSEIKMGSLESMLKGGIEMSAADPKAPKAKAGTTFALLDKAPEAAPQKKDKAVESRTSSM